MQLTGICGPTVERSFKDRKGFEVRQQQFTMIDDTAGDCDCVLPYGSPTPPRGADVVVIVESVRAPAANMLFYRVKEWRFANGNGSGSSVSSSVSQPVAQSLPPSGKPSR
jgi:hypothetical protein